jgi:hypothetical protein
VGLLDNLGLGDMLKGLLGQAESAGLPSIINTVLAQTQYRDLNGLVAALQKGGLGPRYSHGSVPAPTSQSARIS